MKIIIRNPWDKIEVIVNEKQKDISFSYDVDLSIIIYGYPYFCNEDKWLTAEDVRILYNQKKEDFIHDIDGIYSIIIIDKQLKKCKIIVDRYGIYTLYHSRKDSELRISDNLEEITIDWKEIVFNKGRIIEYLNFGFKLGDDTVIKGIEKFAGANIYYIDESIQIKSEKYWDLFDITEDEKITKEQFHAIFNEHIRKAIALGKTISLPLTGGRDSRIILSASLPYKEKIHCYTHGPKNHTDNKQAKVIADHFGIVHQHYDLGDEFGKSLLERAKGNSSFLYGAGSFFDYMHVKNSFELELATGDLLLTGILGNQLYRHHPIGDASSETDNKEDTVALIIRQLPSVFTFRTNLLEYYDRLFIGINGKDIYNMLQASILKVLEKSDKAIKALDYTRLFMFDTYCGNHAVNTMRFTGKYFKLIGAFFHKDLLKQFRFVDLKEMIDADIHEYIIKKNSNYLSELKYYNSGRVVKYLKLFSNKISTKFFNKQIFKHPDCSNYHLWLKKFHKEFLVQLFTYQNMLSADLFTKEELNKIVDIYLSGKIYISSKKKLLMGFSIEKFMLNLISLELWLKDFIKDKKYRFE